MVVHPKCQFGRIDLGYANREFFGLVAIDT